MISLAGKGIDNLVQIPLALDEKRLEIEPNKDNNVYVIDEFFFHYQIVSEEPLELKKFRFDISKNLARTSLKDHSLFIDSSEKLKYWNIEVWEEIPREFRDIFFYHEIIESIHMAKGLPQPKAHETARSAEMAYTQKHLTIEDQMRFTNLVNNLIKQP